MKATRRCASVTAGESAPDASATMTWCWRTWSWARHPRKTQPLRALLGQRGRPTAAAAGPSNTRTCRSLTIRQSSSPFRTCRQESVAVCDTAGFAEMIVAKWDHHSHGTKRLYACMNRGLRKRLKSTSWKWKVNHIYVNLPESMVNPCIYNPSHRLKGGAWPFGSAGGFVMMLFKGFCSLKQFWG